MAHKAQKKKSKIHLYSLFGVLSILAIVTVISLLLGGRSTGMAVQQTEKTYFSCTDSDFDNQFIAGTAIITYTEKGLKKSEVVADTCTSKTLKEAICNGGKFLVYQSSTCVNGCGRVFLTDPLDAKKKIGVDYCKCNADSQCGKGYICLKGLCTKK